MAAFINTLCVILFLSLMATANAYCSSKDLSIEQVATGKRLQNRPVWKVTITNTCLCTQLDVKVTCAGFNSIETVYPRLVSKSGSLCTVNGNTPIFFNQPLSFTYAAETSFPFTLFSSNVACS